MRPSLPKPILVALLLVGCGQADPTVFRPGFGDHGNALVVDGGSVDASADVTPTSNGGDASAANDSAQAGDAPEEAHVAPREAGDGTDASDAAMTANAFTGAPAYTPTTGTTTLNAAHNFAGNTPTTNPAGQPCLTCHAVGGPGVEFMIGGTVWKDPGATTPAPQVEVATRDNGGISRSAYTDAYGNFFVLKADAGTFAPPVHPGVRDATNTRLMVGAIDDGSCNNCHKTGGQTPINVP
jgi:Flp pilus assembly protein TadG